MTTVDIQTTGLFNYLRMRSQVKARMRNTRLRASTWMERTVRFVLHTAGFCCLTIGAFSLHFAAGMVIAGLSCFMMSMLNLPADKPPTR